MATGAVGRVTRRIAGVAALLVVGAATWATGVATAAVTWTLVATPLAVTTGTPTTFTIPGSKTARQFKFQLKGYGDSTVELVPDRAEIKYSQALQKGATKANVVTKVGDTPAIKVPDVRTPEVTVKTPEVPVTTPELKPEIKPETKPEVKPAGKLRDLKDPFAN